MSSVRRVGFPWTTGFTKQYQGDGIFIPVTGWMSAADVAKVRATWEHLDETLLNMVTRPGYQTANLENAPDAALALGTDTQTGNGVKYGSSIFDISSATQGKALVRLGIWVRNSGTDTNLQCVRLAGFFEIQSPC